jgi:hypothetical protein
VAVRVDDSESIPPIAGCFGVFLVEIDCDELQALLPGFSFVRVLLLCVHVVIGVLLILAGIVRVDYIPDGIIDGCSSL